MKTEEYVISLTGKDSHKIIREPGVGSISIGTKGVSSGEFDVWVEENDTINWDAFNQFYVPATLSKKEKYPYGDWPRFIHYSGTDLGFIEWSKKRKIEQLDWYPQKDIRADFSNSNISCLEVHASKKIQLLLGENIIYLKLYGNLNNYIIEKCSKVPYLIFLPKYEKNIISYSLPIFSTLVEAEEVYVSVDPCYPPFDCNSLLQFPNLKQLYLEGNITNLHALKELKLLEKIGVWNARDLSNFPNLSDWKNLYDFVAINIDETVGKRLRSELRGLKKIKMMEEYSNVSKLRSPEWFESNYGIPFASWERGEKKALAIYKKCLKKVNEAKSENDVKEAIIEYTEEFNKMRNIESEERDDIYISLCKIMDNSQIKITREKWFSWFDSTRLF